MQRALWTAAAGMAAQQTNLDVISNNLANVNTTGFKRSRAEFQDLLYQTINAPGTASSASTNLPVGVEIGLLDHGDRMPGTGRNPYRVRWWRDQGALRAGQVQGAIERHRNLCPAVPVRNDPGMGRQPVLLGPDRPLQGGHEQMRRERAHGVTNPQRQIRD